MSDARNTSGAITGPVISFLAFLFFFSCSRFRLYSPASLQRYGCRITPSVSIIAICRYRSPHRMSNSSPTPHRFRGTHVDSSSAHSSNLIIFRLRSACHIYPDSSVPRFSSLPCSSESVISVSLPQSTIAVLVHVGHPSDCSSRLLSSSLINFFRFGLSHRPCCP